MSLEVFTGSITKNTLHHVFFAYELSENFRITLNSFIPKLLKSLAENIKQNIFWSMKATQIQMTEMFPKNLCS